MIFSVKKYAPKHHEIAKARKRVLFMWEMDKRYVEDPNDRVLVQCCGTISPEKARRIWKIITENETGTLVAIKK